jgi:hypothetical protein
MSCTPSAKLEDEFVEKSKKNGSYKNGNSYSKEGTLAHEFAELILRKHEKIISTRKFNIEVKKIKANELYYPGMDEEVEKYTSYVLEEYSALRKDFPNAVLLIEERVDFSEYVPEGFGSDDSIIIAGTVMRVQDLKFGKGIKVFAENNPQLMLYGLGALARYGLLYDIQTVILVIHQPRLDNISEWEISVEDLVKWGEEKVKPAAEIAFKGEGVQVPGEHCQFCKVSAVCKASADRNMAVIDQDFPEPRLLNKEQLLDIYEILPQITKWANSVGAYILMEALKGEEFEGYKVVEGRSNRMFSDQEKVKQVLENNMFAESEYLNIKLKGLGDITKLVGKELYDSDISSLVIKPQGKPTLVEITDKRPAIGADSADSDFSTDSEDGSGD